MPWRPSRRQPIRARHFVVAVVLLALAALESVLWLHRTPTETTTGLIARVTGLEGQAARLADSGSAPATEALAPGSAMTVGDVVQTRPGARLTLRRSGGLTIHVGPDTTATWDSPDALRLSHGVVYIDTEGVGTEDRFVLVTHAGRIRHVGTRFGVEVDDRHVRVTVRDGAIRLSAVNEVHELQAGKEGRIGADGDFVALPLQADAGPWNWMLDAAPRFAIEGRPLHEVASELAAAAGASLSWDGTDVARHADELLLHGPTLTLPARQALDAVMLTTRFRLRDDGRDADGTVRLEVVER
jgi:ferric-dicitrate binding protein FerR (iron transport regulator)